MAIVGHPRGRGGVAGRGGCVPAAFAAWAASLWRLSRSVRRIESGPCVARRIGRAARPRASVWPYVISEPRRADADGLGTFRPRLLLPAEADGWSADRRAWCCCTNWPTPNVATAWPSWSPTWPAWSLVQPAVLDRVQADAARGRDACDDLVLAAGRTHDYAQHLLEIASGLKSGMLAAYSSIAMARKSNSKAGSWRSSTHPQPTGTDRARLGHCRCTCSGRDNSALCWAADAGSAHPGDTEVARAAQPLRRETAGGAEAAKTPAALLGRLASGIEVEMLGVGHRALRPASHGGGRAAPWRIRPITTGIDAGPAKPGPGQLGRGSALFEG